MILNDVAIGEELEKVAPILARTIQEFPSRITVSLTTGDAVNGYGSSVYYVVSLEMLVHLCAACGETQFSRPTFDCSNHRFQTKWLVIDQQVGPNIEQVLRTVDGKIKQWRLANLQQ